MAIDLEEQDGQTPLDPDEKAGLLPEHLATKNKTCRATRKVKSEVLISKGFFIFCVTRSPHT